MESAMFGHEPNAVTGKGSLLVGALERASRGTLLLDEISELRLHVQGRLLRALQEKKIQRLGGTHPIQIDVRVIATTTRDLASEAAAGRFMRELHGYFSVVSIRVPPLRERLDDIPPLVGMFVEWNARQLGLRVPAIPPETFEYLRQRPWPGNIRELANAIERAMLLRTGPVLLPESFGRHALDRRPSAEGGAPDHRAAAGSAAGRGSAEDILHIRTLERIAIHRALKKTGGHKAKAAELLGINERTLRNKLKAEALPVWVSNSEDSTPPEAGEAGR